MLKWIFLLALSFCSLAVAQEWEWQHPQPTGEYLRSMTFSGTQYGWAVGDNGTVVRTTDGGDTWQRCETGTLESLCVVGAASPERVWVAGGHKLLGSTDGGVMWSEVELPEGAAVRDILFTSVSKGWIIGFDDLLLHTIDRGDRWYSAYDSSIGHSLQDIYFLTDRYGWVVSDWGLYLTTDEGQSWTYVGETPRGLNGIQRFQFINENTGWLTGTEGLYRTVSGGDRWELLEGAATANAWDIRFLDDQFGWITRRPGDSIVVTTDGGESWNAYRYRESFSPAYSNSPVWFVSREMGWVAGAYGNIQVTANGGRTWSWHVNHGERAIPVRKIYFASSQMGLAVGTRPGAQRTVIFTPNGGEWWAEYHLPRNSGAMYDVQGFSDGNMYILSSSGVFHSSDYGQTWETSSHLANALACSRPPHIWTVTRTAQLQISSNHGMSWSMYPQWQSPPLNDIVFTDSLHGWIAADSGSIYRTTDGGEEWLDYSDPSMGDVVELTIGDTLNGWAETSTGLLVTTNGGVSWEHRAFPVEGRIEDIACGLGGAVWSLAYLQDSSEYVVYETDEQWGSWREIYRTRRPLYSLAVAPGGRLYLGGSNGMILASPAGTEANPDVVAPLPQSLALSAFPNPFNPSTTLQFTLPVAGRVRITLYDVLGRQVAMLADDFRAAGDYRVPVDGNRLASGVYFAVLDHAGQTTTTKLLLLR